MNSFESMRVDTNYSRFAPDHLKDVLRQKDETKKLEAAQDFEAVFIQQALKQMRPKMEGGLFNAGQETEVFYQFMDEAISKEIAKSPNNFGLADQVYKQSFR